MDSSYEQVFNFNWSDWHTYAVAALIFAVGFAVGCVVREQL